MFNEKKFKRNVLNNNSYQLSLLTKNKASCDKFVLFIMFTHAIMLKSKWIRHIIYHNVEMNVLFGTFYTKVHNRGKFAIFHPRLCHCPLRKDCRVKSFRSRVSVVH